MDTWDITKIQKILPHRYPFLLVDKVLDVNKEEQTITYLKNVTLNEYFFEGHFPGKPIMPGVLIVEALAQASILLYSALKPEIAEKNPIYYLGNVDVKFKKPVCVGDRLILEAHIEKLLANAGIIKGFAKVNDAVMAEAKIVFGVKVP
ncbi:MAG: 3-hydroxyacyl-ACP dehydratase FabZ [Candidatus Omnitrophica bacterium]|nr:3-hydroxyacyl-ACP dehydratase FabZ [Candidatus Omnitrophota bacterium]